MATIKVPTVTIRWDFADIAIQQPNRVLITAALGPAATGVANAEPRRLLSSSDAFSFFGASDGFEAAKRFFELGLSSFFDLYGYGLDDTGWTANTWTVTITGTATESKDAVLRLGRYVIPVAISKDDTATVAATKVAAAVEASNAPWDASALAGVVTLTSQHLGLHTQRYHVSLDLYRDRGETGVAGLSFAVVNNVDATGSPTLTTTNLGTRSYRHYIGAFQTTAWLDALSAWIDARWESGERGHAIIAHEGTQSSAVALATVRNDTRVSYMAIANAPEFETTAAMAFLSAIQDGIVERGVSVFPSQFRVLEMNSPTLSVDAAILLDAGIVPLQVSQATVRAVRMIVSRRFDADDVEDLRQYDMAAFLRARELGDRLDLYLTSKLDLAIVDNVNQLSPDIAQFATSLDQIRTELSALLVQAVRDAILDVTIDDAQSVIQSLQLLESGAIKTGFSMVLEPRIVQNSVVLDALILLR